MHDLIDVLGNLLGALHGAGRVRDDLTETGCIRMRIEQSFKETRPDAANKGYREVLHCLPCPPDAIVWRSFASVKGALQPSMPRLGAEPRAIGALVAAAPFTVVFALGSSLSH
jgi:hypothetical protein